MSLREREWVKVREDLIEINIIWNLAERWVILGLTKQKEYYYGMDWSIRHISEKTKNEEEREREKSRPVRKNKKKRGWFNRFFVVVVF